MVTASIGELVLCALRDAKNSTSEKLTDKQIVTVIEATLRKNGWRQKMTRAERSELDVAMAQALGFTPETVPKPRWGRISYAVKEIIAVCPDVNSNDITQAMARFRRMHPTWGKDSFTENSLVMHWHEVHHHQTEQTASSRMSIAPPGWKECLERICSARGWEKAAIDVLTSRGWAGLSLEHRQKIIKELNQPQQQ